MRRRILSFLFALFLFIAPVSAMAASGSTTVYITNTGECYHTSTCRYLKKSKISITLQEAVNRGYRACKVCKPPQLSKEASTRSAPNATPKPTSTPKPTPTPTPTPKPTPKPTKAPTPKPTSTPDDPVRPTENPSITRSQVENEPPVSPAHISNEKATQKTAVVIENRSSAKPVAFATVIVVGFAYGIVKSRKRR